MSERMVTQADALMLVALMQATWWMQEMPDEAVDLLAARMTGLPDKVALQRAVDFLMNTRERWPTWNHIRDRYSVEVRALADEQRAQQRALESGSGVPMPEEVKRKLRELRRSLRAPGEEVTQ